MSTKIILRLYGGDSVDLQIDCGIETKKNGEVTMFLVHSEDSVVIHKISESYAQGQTLDIMRLIDKGVDVIKAHAIPFPY